MLYNSSMVKSLLQPGNLTKWLPWALFTVVTVLSVTAWAEFRHWQFDRLSLFALFPLFGLLAWSIMWTHYAVGAVSQLNGMPRNKQYSKISAAIVLACILLHPTLLAIAMWQSTGKLPPDSFYGYVAPSLKYAVAFGSLGLIIFLSFDVFKRLRNKPWVDRNWRWISVSQMIAMILIFIHGLALGQNLQAGWFQLWWIVLGALLIPCFGLALRRDFSRR